MGIALRFRYPKWLGWLLLAIASWGAWAILSKSIGDALTPAQSQAVSTFGMLPLIALLYGFSRASPTEQPHQGNWLAFLAGLISCAGNMPYYGVLSAGAKAATIVPFTALYPLITIVLAVVLLRERLNGVQIMGILLALVAIYLFNVREDRNIFSPWLPAASLAFLLWGIAGFFQKLSTNYLSGSASALWFHLAFVMAGGLLFFSSWPMKLTPQVFVKAFALGFTLALGNVAVLMAYARSGPASVVTPLAGLYPLVSIPLAMLIYGERLNVRESLGIAVALIAVLALALESPPSRVPAPRERLDGHDEE